MKKNIVLLLATVVLQMAFPQQANAQFLKNLGKVLQTVGEGVLNGTANTTQQQNQSSSSTSSVSAPQQSAPNPRINIAVANCTRVGRHAFIELTLTNNSGQDKEVEIYNEWEDFTTKVIDEAGAKYGMGIVVNNSLRDLSVTSFVSVKCPRDVPVKVLVIAQNVPQETTSICRLDFTVEKFVTTIRNIPIKETNLPTNREGLTCNMPYIQCYYQSCVRNGNNWEVLFTLTADRDIAMKWKTNDVGIYDMEGNTYRWTLQMPTNQSGEGVLLKQTPTAMKLSIKDVPASITQLHTLLLPFSVTLYRMPFSFEIRMTGLVPNS